MTFCCALPHSMLKTTRRIGSRSCAQRLRKPASVRRLSSKHYETDAGRFVQRPHGGYASVSGACRHVAQQWRFTRESSSRFPRSIGAAVTGLLPAFSATVIGLFLAFAVWSTGEDARWQDRWGWDRREV